MAKNSAGFERVAAIEQRETAHVAGGGERRVFYHPGRNANVVFDGSGFQVQGVPKGYTLDVDAWEAGDGTGPASLKKGEPVPAAPEQKPAEEKPNTDGDGEAPNVFDLMKAEIKKLPPSP